MFTQKPPKSEKPDKGPYTYHPIIEHEGMVRNWNQGFIRVVSIDPGEKRIAFRVSVKYDDKNIQPEMYELWDLSKYSTAYIDGDTSYIYSYLMNKLDQYKDLFIHSHFILIERQMAINFRMTRMFGVLVSYFLRKLRKGIYLPMIYEVDAQLKSKVLGCPKGYKGTQLKKWDLEMCTHILNYRNDTYSLNKLKSYKTINTKYDLADTVVQEEAFLKHMGYKVTFDNLNAKTTITYSLTINPNQSNIDPSMNLQSFMNNNNINVNSISLDLSNISIP